MFQLHKQRPRGVDVMFRSSDLQSAKAREESEAVFDTETRVPSIPAQRAERSHTKGQKSRTARHPDTDNSSFLIQKAVRAELSSNSGGFRFYKVSFYCPVLSSFSAVSVGIRYTIPEEAGAAAVRVSSSGAGFPTRKT